MGKKSDVVWLVEPGMREIPRKTLEEAKELLAQGKDYVRHVIRAWIERKRVRWQDYTFQPERLGVEVYVGRKYDVMWSNKAIEAVFYKVALEDEGLIEAAAKARGAEVKKTSDEDQVDVDVVINVEAPKQAKDIEAEEIGEDVIEAEDVEEDLGEDLEEEE